MQVDHETEEVEIEEPLNYWADKQSVAAPVPTLSGLAYKMGKTKGKEKGKDQRDKGKPWVSLCTNKGQFMNKGKGKGWWQPGMGGDESDGAAVPGRASVLGLLQTRWASRVASDPSVVDKVLHTV